MECPLDHASFTSTIVLLFSLDYIAYADMSDLTNKSAGDIKTEDEVAFEEKSIFEDDEPIASSFMEVGERVLQYTSQAFVMGSIVGLVLVKVPTDATSHGNLQSTILPIILSLKLTICNNTCLNLFNCTVQTLHYEQIAESLGKHGVILRSSLFSMLIVLIISFLHIINISM